MSATEARTQDSTRDVSDRTVDMKLEVVVIPVSDIDRATKFYKGLGWRQDVTPPGSGVVQLTPPGSGCSVQFGANRTTAAPGSAQGLWLIVSDIQAALDKLAAAGVKADEVYHFGATGKASGVDPQHSSYRSFASFHDPDGNRWLIQEITTRLPGRIDSATTNYANAPDLANAMRRASVAHGEHEKRIGAADPNWPDWYASYMVAEQSGAKLPT
jgi:catechol 2,3-dioxygenase-like lactoylglutathione lyase family enzyme